MCKATAIQHTAENHKLFLMLPNKSPVYIKKGPVTVISLNHLFITKTETMKNIISAENTSNFPITEIGSTHEG
jgi:hypothetical protein